MINSFQELENKVNKCIEQAMKMTRDEIFHIISDNLVAYYQESVFDGSNTPQYERTGTLMESFTASHLQKTGNVYSFTVGWDDDYLEFTYPGWENRWGRGLAGKNRATGADVLTYMSKGMHGGHAFIGEHNVWQESLDEINARYGSIGDLFKKNLKATGLPIN